MNIMCPYNQPLQTRIDSIDLKTNIYEKANKKFTITRDKTRNKINIEHGVRQEDAILPKLFTLTLQDIFKQLNRKQRNRRINDRQITHSRFNNVIVIMSTNVEELHEMLTELKTSSEKVSLNMNMAKTKVMTTRKFKYVETKFSRGIHIFTQGKQADRANKSNQRK